MAGFICSFSVIYILLSVSFDRSSAAGQSLISTSPITTDPSAPCTCTKPSTSESYSPFVAVKANPSPPPPITGNTTNSSIYVPNPSEAPPPSRNHTDIAPSPLGGANKTEPPTPPGPLNKPESPSPPKGHQPESPISHKGSQKNLALVVAVPIAGGLVIILLLICIFLVVLSRTKVEEDYVKQVPGIPLKFSYKDLRNATEDFKERLGGGGFGTVYKGVLADGTIIAVKRLDKVSQGMKEFLAEVDTIGSVHHFNLVRLIGYCAEKSFRLLVYEYMSNGSLDNWIFYRDQKPCLDWQTRKKIILDIAKGLAYLHEDCRQRIVHLDIKPQNILLDENFNAKISDFGLSKLIGRDESQVQTTMRGTVGYIAPEWRQLRITLKVDIYSFGIVLLETVCARRNLDRSRSESSMHLLRVLQQKAEEGGLIDLVDNFDEDIQSHREEVERMIRIAAWCLQDDHTRRPSMSTVVKALEGVMMVDPNINYKFAYAMASAPVVNDHVSPPERPGSVLSAVNDHVSSPAQPGSVLSAPR